VSLSRDFVLVILKIPITSKHRHLFTMLIGSICNAYLYNDADNY
jgi:hypothetical protein